MKPRFHSLFAYKEGNGRGRKNRVDGYTLLENRRRGIVSSETLDVLTENGVEITADEVRKVTGFGEEGAKLVANYSNADGATFNKVLEEVKASYMTGFKQPDLNVKKGKDVFISKAQEDAFTAGQMDRKMEDLAAKERFRNAVVNMESGVLAENLPSDVKQSEVATLNLLAEGLGVKAYMAKGLKGNAEYNRQTGEVPIDFDFEREVGGQKVSIVFHAAHEIALHRVVDLAPEEGSAFVYAMYNHIAGNEPSIFTVADQKRSAYAAQGEEISLAKAMEEVSANNILYLYGNDEARFHKAIDSIINGTDEKAKQGLRKYIEYLAEMIRKIRDFLAGKSAKEKAKIQPKLDEITSLRDMFETAVAKAVENKKAVEAKAHTKQTAEAQKNTDTEDGVDFSLKNVDGKSFVWIEESGLTNKQLNSHQAVAGYIAQHIGEVYTIIESGQKVYIGEDLPQEYTHSKYTTFLRRVNRTAARGKNKAVDGFGELIETATNRRWEKTQHTHNKDAKYGMYRYANSFAFPIKDNRGKITKVRAFDVELLIRNASDGNKYLYDIVGIEENTTAEIGLLERMTRLPAERQATRDSVSNDNIPQNSNSVKNEISLKKENSSDTLEKNMGAEYNGNTSYSLKWRTDLNATQFKMLEDWIRQVENHEPKRIADTVGCWYKGRIDGEALFAIYSTETPEHPTILYERKGDDGSFELDILIDLLEDEEDGKGINGKPSFAQRVSQGSWLQNVNSSQNNLRNLGGGRHNQNVGVLPRQSQRNGSRAFRNVLENLFRESEEKSYSLKRIDGQKNTAPEGGVDFSLKTLGYADKVFDFEVTQSDINRYIEKAYLNDNEKSYIKFLKVGRDLINEVSSDVDISGYSHALRDNDIRHIKNSHGKKTNEKYPVTEADVELIPYIVENYDKVFYKTNANGDPGLIYVKVMPGDVIYYVEAITTEYNREKLLINKQMVKTGIDSIPNLYGLIDAIHKKQSSSQYLADLHEIRKAYVQDVKENYSRDNISHPQKIVKSDFSLKDSDYIKAVESVPARRESNYSDEFVKSTFESFGIDAPGDYIHVQRQVLKTLLGENFFTDTEKRKRVDVNEDSGMIIETNKSGIDETFNLKNYARLGKNKKITKLATIRRLPEIIEKGRLVADNVQNQYGNSDNKKFAYIEHTLEVDGKDVTIRLDIKKSPQKNKFWVHRVWEKETANTFPASINTDAEAGHTSADLNKSVAHPEQKVKSDFSLKGMLSEREYVATIQGLQKGDEAAKRKLAKYVEKGHVSTELYNELIERYGAIPSGEKPHRDIQVPQKTGKNKKVSQTVRTILEAKATPDEALPTIEKMVEDGIFSYDAYTDKKALKEADTYIKEYGWDESLVKKQIEK